MHACNLWFKNTCCCDCCWAVIVVYVWHSAGRGRKGICLVDSCCCDRCEGGGELSVPLFLCSGRGGA